MAEFRVHKILQSVWPDWEIVRLLGSGSYGNVYKIHKNINTYSDNDLITSDSALKVIFIPNDDGEIDVSHEYTGSESKAEPFRADELSREITLLDSLRGAANIVHMEDHYIYRNPDNSGWTILIRMELLESIREYYPFTEEETVKLGIDICSALEVCAKQRIIHNDIKPTNILINKFGDYKLGDFGISRILQQSLPDRSGHENGTPNYMAPEIGKGMPGDFRADIYSLGLVMYTLLNDQKPPFYPMDRQILQNRERMEALQRRIDGNPLPPPCYASSAMAGIILKACAPRPEERYKSAAEMKRALIQLRDQKKKRNRPAKFRIVSAVLAAALLTAVGCFHFAQYNIPTAEDQTETKGAAQTAETTAQTQAPAGSYGELQYMLNADESSYTVTGILDKRVDKVVVPETYNDLPVTVIGAGAFERCEMEQIQLPESIEKIECNAFLGCVFLQEIVIPASVTEIQYQTAELYGSPFTNCNSLDVLKVDEENPVYYSADNCIIERETGILAYGCRKSVIPRDGSVREIGRSAFEGCRGISEIQVPEGVTRINANAFLNAGLQSIFIPASAEHIDPYAFLHCENLFSISIADGNPVYHSDGNCIIKTESKWLQTGCIGSVIPSDGSVVGIGDYAFFHLDQLYQIDIPEGIVSIGRYAFFASALQHLELPASVRNIHETAFNTCVFLETISVSEDNAWFTAVNNCLIRKADKTLYIGCPVSVIPDDGSVKRIGVHSFYGMGNENIEIPDSVDLIYNAAFVQAKIQEIRIPDGITQILDFTFQGCENLETIYLPASLVSISWGAFERCGNLKTVYFAGTKEGWNDIVIAENNDDLFHAEIITEAG